MSWHIQNPKLFQEIKSKLSHEYPNLYLFDKGGYVYARGGLVLRDPKDREVETFQIEIKFPTNYPNGIPETKETAGRFPKTPERHFNPPDSENIACLFLPDERYKYYPRGSDIVHYIENCLKPFLFWQLDFEFNGSQNSLPARSHGVEGRIEFYEEELQTNDLQTIVRCLEYLSAKKVKKHWSCYCGSGKQIQVCHHKRLTELRGNINKKDARNSLKQLNRTKSNKSFT